MHGRSGLIGSIFAMTLLGCFDPAAPERSGPVAPDDALAQAFVPGQTGNIQGRVVWDGELPVVEQKLVSAHAFNPYFYKTPAVVSTPHVPKVNSPGNGVENAVVWLRSVDAHRSRPWNHAQPRVEIKGRQIVIEQDGRRSGVGFVQRGSAVEIVNRDAEYHNLRARGAAFFGLPLIEQNQTHERVLSESGIVDLTCAAGYYSMHAHLFVVEHPYYALTDADGRFQLDQVPAGNYELVCWLPSWRVARSERDPETGTTVRLLWENPKEQTQTVRVEAGRMKDITYRWDQNKFGVP